MADTSIEWTRGPDGAKGKSWNPVTGCTQISPGCANCYALTFAERWRGTAGHPYEQGFDVTLRPERLAQPATWRKPTIVFVNSMSDLFHEAIPDDYIQRVFGIMQAASWHTFLVLTKRPARMATLDLPWAPNVWAGVSVENQRWTSRIDDLRKVPAAVRFLSCEPLLGPLDLDLRGVGWVIVGGESGARRRARPMDPAWARSIRDQAAAAGVPFFFKQWGVHGPDGVPRSKKANGSRLDGVLYDAIPPRPGAVVASSLL